MNKGLAFLSASVAVGAVVVSVVACEDDKGSTFNNGDDGGSFDSGGSFNVDGNTPVDTGSPVNCTPSLPATFNPTWKAPVARAGQCQADELTGYFDACLPKIDAAGCLAWLDEHKTCAECIEPDDNSGAIQIYSNRTYLTLNVAGCIALVQNQLGADKCGAMYDRAAQCRRQSCDDCFSLGGTFQNFTDCQNKAAQTGCKTYEDQSSAACVGYKDPDGGAPDCFPRSQNEQNRDHFVRVMGIMCGT